MSKINKQEKVASYLPRIKDLVNEYVKEWYGHEADFSDPKHIVLVDDEVTAEKIPVQAYLDLKHLKMVCTVAGYLAEEQTWGSIEELVAFLPISLVEVNRVSDKTCGFEVI